MQHVIRYLNAYIFCTQKLYILYADFVRRHAVLPVGPIQDVNECKSQKPNPTYSFVGQKHNRRTDIKRKNKNKGDDKMSEETCSKTAFFRNLLTIDAHCHEWLGASPLRPDAKLFLLIAARGSLTIKEAMHTCSLSNRAFYQMVDRLKSEGKIAVVTDKDDRRVHRIVARRRLRGIPDAVKSLVANMGCLNGDCASKQKRSIG